MLILVENMTLLSNCAYYPGTKPGKKHALNNQYALNRKLHLLTRVYGISQILLNSAHAIVYYTLVAYCNGTNGSCAWRLGLGLNMAAVKIIAEHRTYSTAQKSRQTFYTVN